MMQNKFRSGSKHTATVHGRMVTFAENGAITDGTVHIEFPVEWEIVTSAGYTLKINSKLPARIVEVSFDNGEWKPCRESDGYWWFDWAGYASKQYSVRARASLADGTNRFSRVRQFMVMFK